MENDKKNKLLAVRSYLLRIPNNKKKIELLEAYYRLRDYYHETMNNLNYDKSSIDIDFSLKYDYYVIKECRRKISEITMNAPNLYSIYEKIVNMYRNNDFCSYEYDTNIKVNVDKMSEIVYDFFNYLGCDVLNIYLNMLDSNNIYLSNNSQYAGFALDTIPIDNPCIVIENIPKYMQFYFTLVHEMGHAYQFYLQRNQKTYSTFDPYVEITSLLFEKLFANYLKENYVNRNILYPKIEDNVYFLNDVSASKVLSRLLIEEKIKNIDPYSLSYKCREEIDDLLLEMENDCGYIMPNKLDLSLDEFHYSISSIIAMYFEEKLKNNFTYEWKNYKDFICTINYLPMNEVINKYFNLDLVENNIKKFIKEYRK